MEGLQGEARVMGKGKDERRQRLARGAARLVSADGMWAGVNRGATAAVREAVSSPGAWWGDLARAAAARLPPGRGRDVVAGGGFFDQGLLGFQGLLVDGGQDGGQGEGVQLGRLESGDEAGSLGFDEWREGRVKAEMFADEFAAAGEGFGEGLGVVQHVVHSVEK
ncbi:hypothetical protein E4N62_18700 [Streptomyces sp. MNU76]|uniref:hypothetical protein n=1 Tax=Streptomyces sp. MNU76 TaxID=2560026 RepID=UPI001E2BDC85|nr:hypothetical protein [Streptomyces sp. MNU76]MCC9707122.1 hypothetical protein [Streptomyces sp. MNU76]